jgi:hypothetical protein
LNPFSTQLDIGEKCERLLVLSAQVVARRDSPEREASFGRLSRLTMYHVVIMEEFDAVFIVTGEVRSHVDCSPAHEQAIELESIV